MKLLAESLTNEEILNRVRMYEGNIKVVKQEITNIKNEQSIRKYRNKYPL